MSKRVLLALLLVAASPLHAVTYTVNDPGSLGDADTSDTTCSTATPANGTTCTLRAAIQQANSKVGPHIIKFASALTKVTLTASLPTVTSPVTLDGTTSNAASGGRVEIDGATTSSCFVLSDSPVAPNNNGARGSVVKNFVLRRCDTHGISLSGHGFTVTGNRIGTNPGATSASSASDANDGAGISISGSILPLGSIPAGATLASQIATLPQNSAGVLALSESVKAALTVIALPNVIAGNVVSGNNTNGLHIFGQGTVNNIVTGNIVGLSQDGLSAIPNGRGPGGSSNKAGIHLSGTAYGNFIGPGNIVSGNLGDGIAIDSGAVQLPNFIAGNLIGLGSAPIASVGNAENGLSLDTVPNGPAHGGADNPTGLSAIIGPANTISDNKRAAPAADLDVMNADDAGGMLINGNARKIKVFANVFGLATFPAGATPLGQLEYGNVANGMVVTGSDNEIRNNLVLANGRHGIVLRGGSGNVIRGNYIGVSVPTGLSPFVSLGNVGDGIHFFNSGGNTVGGPAASDANFIASNGRHGIALRQSNSWANLITRNRIYGNAKISPSGIGIDLEHPLNGPDGLDTIDNPGLVYANHDQHRPAICGGANDPPACAGAKAPISDGSGGGTATQWTIKARPNAPANTIRIEFFANAADGSDQMFLGEKLVGTNASGLPTGAGCSNGLCTTSVGGSTGTAGMRIVATATDLTPADVPPTNEQPPLPLSPSNNTSEFSDTATATPKLKITTQPPLPSGDTGVAYPGVTFAATGGSGSYVNWIVSNGNLPNGLAVDPGTGVLSGTPTVANTFNFTVKVTDSAAAEATAAYAITVTATPPLIITTPSPLPGGTVGTAYSLTFAASGGNGAAGNWKLQNGALPAGLSLSTTGVLDGTPTEVGTFEFNVQTTDAQPTTVVKAFTLTVVPAPVPLAITTASPLPNATATLNYTTQTFAATGGSGVYVAWATVAGALPTGIALDPDSGQLSGKPTTAGSYSFTVRVTDDANTTATKAFVLTVAAAPEPPPAGPVFSASPANIDFGEINVGRTAFADVRLTNLTSDVTYTPRLTQPSAASGFAVDYGTCDDINGNPVPLAPGAFCTMMVAFTPTAGGGAAFSAASTVCRTALFNGNQCLFIIGQPTPILARLTYRGIGSGTLAQVAPTKIDFGSQPLGSQTNVVVTITNPTDANLTYPPTLVFSNPNQFSLVTQNCIFGVVTPTTPCNLTLRFAPVVPGVAESSTRITVSGGGGSIVEPYDIELRGTGVLVSDPIRTAPVALDFGMVDVGNTAQIPVVTTNASGVQLGIFATLFGTGETVWSRVIGGCPNPTNPAQTCTWNYRFTPRAQGEVSTSSEITATNGSSVVIQTVPLSLTGTGVGSLIEASPTRLDFGLVNIGEIGRGRVSITNTSVDTLTRTFLEPFPFLDSTTCAATLAPDASCVINYSIVGDGDPLGPVVSQATLLFENSATGNQQIVTIDLSARLIDELFSDGFE